MLWKALSPTNYKRVGNMQVFHIQSKHKDDRILLIGGEYGWAKILPEFYDIKTDTWHTLTWDVPFNYTLFTVNIVADNLILINMDHDATPQYQIYIRPFTFENMLENIPFTKLPSLPYIEQDYLWSCSIDD